MANFRIRYTSQALKDQETIYEFVLQKWGLNSVIKLDKKIEKALELISKSPEICPSTSVKNVRRCVITEQTTLYFRIINLEIELLTFFDTRQHPKKRKLK